MRLFLALEPDDLTRAHVANVGRQVLETLREAGLERAVRVVAPANCHLTLLFMGEVEEGNLPEIECQLLEATRTVPPQVLEVANVGAFPNLLAPRVLWLGAGEVEGGNALPRLHADLTRRLELLCPQADARPLRPHLTLARVNRIEASQRRKLSHALDAMPTPKPLRWTVREISLVRSDLLPNGPLYSTLTTAPLIGTPLTGAAGAG